MRIKVQISLSELPPDMLASLREQAAARGCALEREARSLIFESAHAILDKAQAEEVPVFNWDEPLEDLTVLINTTGEFVPTVKGGRKEVRQ